MDLIYIYIYIVHPYYYKQTLNCNSYYIYIVLWLNKFRWRFEEIIKMNQTFYLNESLTITSDKYVIKINVHILFISVEFHIT